MSMVLRRMLRLQRAGDSGSLDYSNGNSAGGLHRGLSRLVYQGEATPGVEGGNVFGQQTNSHHLRGHGRRGWRSLQPPPHSSSSLSSSSSFTTPLPSSASSVSSSSSSSSSSLPPSHESDPRYLPRGIEGEGRGGLDMNFGGADQQQPQGGYDITDKDSEKDSYNSGYFNSQSDYQYPNYASNNHGQRLDEAYVGRAHQGIEDARWDGSNIPHGSGENIHPYSQQEYPMNTNTGAATALRRRTQMASLDSLQGRHQRGGPLDVHDRGRPSERFQDSQSPYSGLSGNQHPPYESQGNAHASPSDSIRDPASMYDALQTSARHATGSGHSSSLLSSQHSSLVPPSRNHTLPAAPVTSVTHAHRQHLHSLPLSSTSSLSHVSSTDSQKLYRDVHSSPSTSSLSSSSASFKPSTSDLSSPFSSSSLTQSSSRNIPSQSFLKHIGLESDKLSSAPPSWSTSSSSSSSSNLSNSFSDKLRRSGLESLNLELDHLSAPTVDAPTSWNFTDDLCFNVTSGTYDNCWSPLFGQLLNMNGTAPDGGGGAISGDEFSTSSPGTLEPEEYKYWTILLIIFPLFTVFGNVLVCMSVVKEKSLKTVTNYFICSLAVADIMVAVVVMPFAVYMEVCTEN